MVFWSGDEIGDEIPSIPSVRVSSLPIPTHWDLVRFPPSPLLWKSMEVHNVPEASDTNSFAEKIKSETFTEYHGISCFGVGKRVGN